MPVPCSDTDTRVDYDSLQMFILQIIFLWRQELLGHCCECSSDHLDLQPSVKQCNSFKAKKPAARLFMRAQLLRTSLHFKKEEWSWLPELVQSLQFRQVLPCNTTSEFCLAAHHSLRKWSDCSKVKNIFTSPREGLAGPADINFCCGLMYATCLWPYCIMIRWYLNMLNQICNGYSFPNIKAMLVKIRQRINTCQGTSLVIQIYFTIQDKAAGTLHIPTLKKLSSFPHGNWLHTSVSWEHIE